MRRPKTISISQETLERLEACGEYGHGCASYMVDSAVAAYCDLYDLALTLKRVAGNNAFINKYAHVCAKLLELADSMLSNEQDGFEELFAEGGECEGRQD